MKRSVHAVFAGGGIKGIALAGAAAAALESGYRFEQLVGTSSGAMIASLLAAGYGPDELDEAVTDIPWPELADAMPGLRIPLIGRHLALAFGLGHHRGQVLERVWRALLREKGVRRFSDLKPESLRILATDLTRQRGVVIPDHLAEYGVRGERFSVARAVRMSAAVPFFYRPVRLRPLRGGRTTLFADGALTSNFPLRLAEWEDRPVLGFTFRESDLPPQELRVRGPASLIRAIVTASMRASGTVRGALMEKATVVEIPAERDSLDFNISPAEAKRMFDEGRRAAQASFDRLADEEVLTMSGEGSD